MEVLCSIIAQQKMNCGKKRATNSLKEEALLIARNYEVKESAGTDDVWKTLGTVLDTRASTNC